VHDYDDAGGPEALGRETARTAREALDAKPCPAGRSRVLTDPHLSGLLAHESFGHLTEYDLVASGWSVLKDRVGERLASELVTIRDSPVVPGSPLAGVRVPYDDEGVEGRDIDLLRKGVLHAWMHTRDSSSATGSAPTGNARALDARFAPIVRMRNTYFEPGEGTVDEAIELLDDGIYLIGGRGGSPRSDGSFMFTAKRGYVVKGGRIDHPIRSVSFHGNVLDCLKGVEFLTSDFAVHTTAFGGCGKWDQSFLHVGTGGPHVLVAEALVGGQAA
jgi:TldD protein